MKIIFFGVILVLAVACAPQKPLTAELRPRSLRAINLEETMSGHDELMMAYSMISYDAQNKPVGVINGGWGVASVQKGQQPDLRSAQSIRLDLPRNGRIVASLVLIEVDDYQRARQMLDQVRQVHNVVAGPAALLLTASEVLPPLKYVAAGLAASGIGLRLLDQFDNDDLLGQSSVELREADMRHKNQRLLHVPVVFMGQNRRDRYEYQLSYDIGLHHVQMQPNRQ